MDVEVVREELADVRAAAGVVDGGRPHGVLPATGVAQFSTVKPGTADRSPSMVTTVQCPRVNAMAAIIMSFLTDGPTNAAEFGSDTAIFPSGFFRDQPELPGSECALKSPPVAIAV